MKKLCLTAAAVALLFSNSWGNLKYKHASLRTKAFFTINDALGRNVMIKGRIESISTSEELRADDLSGIAREKTKATVRLYEHRGIKENDILYVINDKNLVVSKFRVKYIFNSRTFGHMLIGYGNFALSQKGYRIAQIVQDDASRYAYIHKSRGDYFLKSGNRGRAVSEYKKAIAMDSGNPSARLALGLVYMKDGVSNFAYSEMKKAYSGIGRLYDNQEKFTLLSSLARICFNEVYGSYNAAKIKERFREEGIRYSKEALKINRKSADMNFLTGEFYYNAPGQNTENDKIARDYYLKAVELNPSHKTANFRLAKLYFRHGNKEKGLFYSEKAVEADPSNAEARELLNRNR